MKYGDIRPDGSFAVRGVGFIYEFIALTGTLRVARATPGSAIFSFPVVKTYPPASYIKIFEKTTQIKALKFTNNASINLAGTLDDPKLAGILSVTATLSDFALCLSAGAHDKFSKTFTNNSGLRHFFLKNEPRGATDRYFAEAETRRGNKISVHSSNLHGVLSHAADKIIEDALAREFSHLNESMTQEVLNAAQKLAQLSLILNETFDPARKISKKAAAGMSISLALQKINLIQ